MIEKYHERGFAAVLEAFRPDLLRNAQKRILDLLQREIDGEKDIGFCVDYLSALGKSDPNLYRDVYLRTKERIPALRTAKSWNLAYYGLSQFKLLSIVKDFERRQRSNADIGNLEIEELIIHVSLGLRPGYHLLEERIQELKHRLRRNRNRSGEVPHIMRLLARRRIERFNH